MDPTIEIAITARLDKLDAALAAAQAKVDGAAKKMGDAGEKAGSSFFSKMGNNIVKGIAVTALTQVIGGSLLKAVEGIHAGKSGGDIGAAMGKGIIDGFKAVPVVGTIVSILDELANGMDRLNQKAREKADELTKRLGTTLRDSLRASIAAARELEFGTLGTKAGDDPSSVAMLSASQQQQAVEDRLQAIREEKFARVQEFREKQAADQEVIRTSKGARYMGGGNFQRATDRGIRAIMHETPEETQLLRRREAIEEQLNDKFRKIDKDAADARTKIEADALKERESNYDRFIAGNIADAIRASEQQIAIQQDIIDAAQSAQAQVVKAGQLDRFAQEAARGMIHSGQTALGQFNFAEQGAANNALMLAKQQAQSLEKIDRATAEIARLAKEQKGFR